MVFMSTTCGTNQQDCDRERRGWTEVQYLEKHTVRGHEGVTRTYCTFPNILDLFQCLVQWSQLEIALLHAAEYRLR